jgi:hypothetical protein
LTQPHGTNKGGDRLEGATKEKEKKKGKKNKKTNNITENKTLAETDLPWRGCWEWRNVQS